MHQMVPASGPVIQSALLSPCDPPGHTGGGSGLRRVPQLSTVHTSSQHCMQRDIAALTLVWQAPDRTSATEPRGCMCSTLYLHDKLLFPPVVHPLSCTPRIPSCHTSHKISNVRAVRHGFKRSTTCSAWIQKIPNNSIGSCLEGSDCECCVFRVQDRFLDTIQQAHESNLRQPLDAPTGRAPGPS